MGGLAMKGVGIGAAGGGEEDGEGVCRLEGGRCEGDDGYVEGAGEEERFDGGTDRRGSRVRRSDRAITVMSESGGPPPDYYPRNLTNTPCRHQDSGHDIHQYLVPHAIESHSF